MNKQTGATLSLLLLSGALSLPSAAPADVNLADFLRAQPTEQVTLDAGTVYTGPVNLGPGDRAYEVDGNGATIDLHGGDALSVNGQSFSLSNATIGGSANSKVVLIESPRVLLEGVLITGNTLYNGIYSIESNVELDGVTVENAGLGMFLSGGSLHFSGAAAFRNCSTGLHVPAEAPVTGTLSAGEEVAFEDCAQNGLLATGTTITLDGALRMVNTGAGLRLTNTAMTINGPGLIRGAQSGIIQDGGSFLEINAAPGRFELGECANNGVYTAGSTLVLNGGELAGNNGYPVHAIGGAVTLAQGTTVRGNAAGVIASGAQLTIRDSEFSDNGDFHVYARAESSATIHSSTFTGSQIAIRVTNGSELEAWQCDIMDPTHYGINMFRTSPGEPAPTGSIRGNTIRTTPRRPDTLWESGINLIDSDNVVVDGNTIEHWRTGVQVNTSTATITNNRIGWIYQPDGFGARGQGVGVINGAHADIRQNHIHDTEGDNIFIAGGSTAWVQANLLERSRENGVLVEGIEPGAPFSSATIVNNDIRNPTVGVGISGNTAAVVVGNSIFVPDEDREFSDPSRAVWIANSPAVSIVENNLMSSAPLNAVYIEGSNNHVIRGNAMINSGRNAAELSGATGVQFLANTAWKSWENGIEVNGGGGHYFYQNNLVDSFQRQLSDAQVGLFYQVAFFNGATGMLRENNFESSLPRKGGLENVGGGAIDARSNWWGAASGPEFNINEQGGPALVVRGSNIDTSGHLTQPPTRARVWDAMHHPAGVPRILSEPAPSIGAQVRFTPAANTGETHVAMAPRSPSVTGGDTGLESARLVQVLVDHRIRSTLQDGLLTLAFQTGDADAGLARYNDISQTWEKLSGTVHHAGEGLLMITRHHLDLPNTVYAVGVDPEADPRVDDFLLGRTTTPPGDQNNDGIIDAADLVPGAGN